MTPVIDTNILIDVLNGVPQARIELARYSDAVISSLTWTEVMVGCREGEEQRIREFLAGYEVLPYDLEIADIAWRLRQRYRMRLPDAAIWATAKHAGTQLITRNSKDFPASEKDIRIPYRI